MNMLPESFSRPFAVPTGIALVGLGPSLRRGGRPAPETATAIAGARPAVVR